MIIFVLLFFSIAFALSLSDLSQYNKGQYITVIEYSGVHPYNESGKFIDIIEVDNKTYLLLQNSWGEMRYIKIEDIIKII